MPIRANVFVSVRRHRRLLLALLWGVLFVAFLCVGWGVVRWQIAAYAERDRAAELARVIDMRRNAVSALERLDREATGTPCSTEFLAAMRRVAFLPDGLNVFLHAPGGMVDCSTTEVAVDQSVQLGEPDIDGDGPNAPDFWMVRNLARLGHPGEAGTIVALRDFAVVIPPHTSLQSRSSWLAKELVAIGSRGKSWTLVGEEGLYRRSEQSRFASGLTTLVGTTCGEMGLHCVVSKAELIPWAKEWILIPLVVVVLSALIAWSCANFLVAWMKRYWSFEARFLRNLDNVVVVYQPIVELRSGRVTGCEVLARWRDVDGSIVAPDRFLGIVERTRRTAEFTRLIVDRASRELGESVPSDVKLQVNFNVFGCDFDARTLLPIFSKFDKLKGRFIAAVELVEDQHVNFEGAQAAMLELRRAGLKIYIDDFGQGYSSIERAATLAVDGVKLDRLFAMSQPDSVFGRMLVQVLEMLKLTGRAVVVEGVETPERMRLLRSTGNVDYVQGFAISRPLSVRDFVSFIADADPCRETSGFAA